MGDMNEARADDARAMAAYLLGETDTHPRGTAGAARIIPNLSQRCWDTSPAAWRFSEWGRDAGIAG